MRCNSRDLGLHCLCRPFTASKAMQGDSKRQQRRSNLSPDSPAFWPTVFQLRHPIGERPAESQTMHEPTRHQPWLVQGGSASGFATAQTPAVSGITQPLPLPYGQLVQSVSQQQPVLWIPVTLAQQPQVVTVPPLSVLSQSIGEGKWCNSSSEGLQSICPGSLWPCHSQPAATPASIAPQAQVLQQAALTEADTPTLPLSQQSASLTRGEETASSDPDSLSEVSFHGSCVRLLTSPGHKHQLNDSAYVVLAATLPIFWTMQSHLMARCAGNSRSHKCHAAAACY